MTRNPRQPSNIDAVVSANVRAKRLAAGLSQEKVAAGLGITFQQIQKYENGTNRVPAGRLWQIARTIGVPVATFYEGADKVTRAPK